MRRLVPLARITCGIACVLLIALWVRSYWRIDGIDLAPNRKMKIFFVSAGGEERCEIYRVPPKIDWEYGILSGSTETHLRKLSLPIQNDPDRSATAILGFRLLSGKMMPLPIIPHWFAAAASGTLAVVLGCGQSFRFSLRTLLIATTLVAAVMGLIVYAVRR